MGLRGDMLLVRKGGNTKIFSLVRFAAYLHFVRVLKRERQI